MPGHPLTGIFVREQAKAVCLYDDVVVLHCPGLNPQLARSWQIDREIDPDLTVGIPTYRVQHRLSPVPKSSYALHLWSVWRAYRRIVADGFQPDVIHAHVYQAGAPAVMLGRGYRRPTVVTEHFSAFLTGSLGPWNRRQARFAFSGADRVLPVSQALQRGIEQMGIKARFEVVPNSVDIALFRPPSNGSERTGPTRILFVGNLVPSKGVPVLLSAIAALRDRRTGWQLDIVGDGPERPEYERLAAALRLEDCVRFLGQRPKAEVAELMRAADCLVSSSLVETFSVVIAEAMAVGLPVVATRCGGPEELVSEDVGILVPTRDPAALCDGLAALLDRLDGYSRVHISTLAGDRFAPARVGARLDALYRRVLAERGRPAP
jgi:glycosyltransferase involved in cell wall biosynthesis